jgi:hypothetical protein
MTTTVKVIATQRVTVRPDVTESVTVVIKAVGPQGPTGSSTGDMTKVVYDPTNVLGDAFAMDNMAEGTLTKIMTSTERTKLAGIQAGATVNDNAAEVKIKYESNLDTNAFTDAEKTLLGNQSGINTGDQDLSGFESAGTAAGLISAHESAHPVPTIRDSRNAPALGVDDNYVTDAEKIVIGNTSGTNTGDQDLSGKENVGVAAGLVTTHETNHPVPTLRDTRNAAALGTDDNYVTDAEKIVIGNTSGTNSGDNPGVTSVAGGTGITSTGGDTPSLSHDAHTGDVTGSTTLTLDKTAITGKSVVTADDADYVLLSDTSDSGNLKKALKSDFNGMAKQTLTDNAIPKADGTGGEIQDTGVIIDDDNNVYGAGVLANAQTGTTYGFVLTDAGKLVTLSNASAITATIPANASVAFPVGTVINLLSLGAGIVTVAITTDTLSSKDSAVALTGQYSAATLVKTGTTTWVLFGDLA